MDQETNKLDFGILLMAYVCIYLKDMIIGCEELLYIIQANIFIHAVMIKRLGFGILHQENALKNLMLIVIL